MLLLLLLGTRQLNNFDVSLELRQSDGSSQMITHFISFHIISYLRIKYQMNSFQTAICIWCFIYSSKLLWNSAHFCELLKTESKVNIMAMITFFYYCVRNRLHSRHCKLTETNTSPNNFGLWTYGVFETKITNESKAKYELKYSQYFQKNIFEKNKRNSLNSQTMSNLEYWSHIHNERQGKNTLSLSHPHTHEYTWKMYNNVRLSLRFKSVLKFNVNFIVNNLQRLRTYGIPFNGFKR